MAVYTLPKHLHPDFAVKGRKPVGAVEIDRENWAANGLVAMCIFNDGGRNLVQGRLPDIDLNGVSTSIENGSSCLKLDGTSKYAKIPAASFPVNDITIAVTYLLRSNDDEMLTGLNYTDNQNQCDFYISGARSSIQWHLAGWDVAGNPVLSEGRNLGVVYTVLGTRNGSTVKLFVYNHSTGEITEDVGAASNSTPIGIAAGYSMLIGADADSGSEGSLGNYADANIYNFTVWGKGINDAEAHSFLKDPYQILKPAVPISYFTAAAAAGFEPQWYRNRSAIIGAGMK